MTFWLVFMPKEGLAATSKDNLSREYIRNLIANHQEDPRFHITWDLASSGDHEAIDYLKSKFTSTVSTFSTVRRNDIAVSLLENGLGNATYFNYVILQSSRVVSAPSVFLTDPGGQAEFNNEFLTWSRDNPDFGSPQEAAMLVPEVIRQLAAMADRRAIPALQNALLSSNPLIVTYAVYGLAKLDDEKSVDAAIRACSMSSKFDKPTVCEGLLYFSHKKAQRFAKRIIPEPMYSISKSIPRNEAFKGWLGR